MELVTASVAERRIVAERLRSGTEELPDAAHPRLCQIPPMLNPLQRHLLPGGWDLEGLNAGAQENKLQLWFSGSGASASPGGLVKAHMRSDCTPGMEPRLCLSDEPLNAAAAASQAPHFND